MLQPPASTWGDSGPNSPRQRSPQEGNECERYVVDVARSARDVEWVHSSGWHKALLWLVYAETLLVLMTLVSWFHLVSYSQGPQMHFSGTDCWVLIPLLLMVTSLLTTIISSRSDTISTVMLAVRLLLFLTLTVVLGLTIAGQMELHQIWFWTKGNAVARWILVTTSFLVWALQIPLVIVMWKRRSQLRDASQPRDKNHQSEFWVDNRPNGMAGIDIAK
ncbi:Uncharacterized protein PBTT_05978 [Plasmodiophora brassicae]